VQVRTESLCCSCCGLLRFCSKLISCRRRGRWQQQSAEILKMRMRYFCVTYSVISYSSLCLLLESFRGGCERMEEAGWKRGSGRMEAPWCFGNSWISVHVRSEPWTYPQTLLLCIIISDKYQLSKEYQNFHVNFIVKLYLFIYLTLWSSNLQIYQFVFFFVLLFLWCILDHSRYNTSLHML